MPPLRLLITAITLIALLHTYIGLRLIPALNLGVTGEIVAVAGLAMSTALIPLGLLARRLRRWRDGLGWAGLLATGLFSSLLVLTLLRDLILIPAWFLVSGTAFYGLSHVSAIVAPVLALLVTVAGLVNARRLARVVEVEIPFAGLPETFDNFTIAQISDVHVGPTIKRGYLQAIVNRVNQLEADMIAITGDLVDGRVAQLAGHVEPLAQLSARYGSYFVTGNHEYYSGVHEWLGEIRRLGVKTLLNEHVILRRGPHSLVVAGVTDFSAHTIEPAHRSDPLGALAGAPGDAPFRILLAHQPRSAHAAARAGYQLQLSGHTHGGQFLPWNFFVRFQQPFTAGLRRIDNLWVYTSRGTGYWGPPKRLGAPSEITLIRLVKRTDRPVPEPPRPRRWSGCR